MRQLLCHHGHKIDVSSPTDDRVVCPLCGSVMTLKAEVNTPLPGPLDGTSDFPEFVAREQRATDQSPVGKTIISEAPALEVPLTVDLPTAPVPPPAPESSGSEADFGNRTIIFDSTAHAKLEAEEQKHAPEVAGFQSEDAQAAAMSGNAFVAPRDEIDSILSSTSGQSQSQSSMAGLRTSVPMPTEIEITEPPELPGYEVLSELGRGGMGVVYRAFDIKLERQVALKTLQRISPIGLQRFKQEFRSLADVSHPNLAGPYDLLSDGKTWCFTMELLEAVDFLEYVWSEFAKLCRDKGHKLIAEVPKSGPRLSLAILQRLSDGLKQLALGLHALHQAGILHRDIKPSNIMVTTEGRVVLVDFGLAAQADGDGRPQGVQGTPDYMAPEQAAGRMVTPASDWYAVGVMLYQLLTGRLPIEGKALQVIIKKQSETPKAPREWEPTIPAELNDLCVALLDRDPAKRPDVFEILNRIGAADVAQTLRSSSRRTKAVELVGREPHLSALRQSFEEVRGGATRSMFVHGKSGMGKSVLIHTFLSELRRTAELAVAKQSREGSGLSAKSIARASSGQSLAFSDRSLVFADRGQTTSESADVLVLTGRCYEQESVPFKALDSLIDSLAAELRKIPADELRPGVPEDSLPLVRLFPVLGQLPGATDAGKPSIDNVDQQELRTRAMNGLRNLLSWLGSRQPVVLYIDDLQWGDVDSAILLGDLMRPPGSPRVLLLGSYRSEYIDTSLCLRAIKTAYTTGQFHPHREEMAVDALRLEDATRLALLLLKCDDISSIKLAGKIARESGGWPFFVWELVQHVQEADDIGDHSLELDEVIWTRVCRLPEETRRLLELIAVAGRPIVAVEAYRALDVGGKGQNLLMQLRTRNLIRATDSDANSTVVETYHDRIRESVVHHLNERTTKRYNLDLAETILKSSGLSGEAVWAFLMNATPFEEPNGIMPLEHHQWRRVYDLSHYLTAAGEHGRALPFAVIAAERARQQNALEVAEQQYRAALLGSLASAPALRFRILEGLGDVLILRGSYAAANEQLQAARALAKDRVVVARIDGKLGRSTFKKGDMGDAVNYLEKALIALDEPPPRNFPSLLLRMSKEGVVQLLHTFFPTKFTGRKDKGSPRGQMDMFRARIFDDLTIAYWFSRSMEMVLWSHLRQMNLVERYQPTQEMGKTYSFHAITMSAIPLADRGINYAKRAYQISVDAGDLWGQGKARSFHTFSCIVLARFQEGVQTGAEAVRLLEQAGDVWEANMARMIAAVPRYHLGDLKTAYRESKKAYEIGLETGDYSAVCISLLFWIPAAPHRIPRGAIQKELERKREDPLSIAGAVYARGLELLLCEDKPAEAAKVLQDCLDRAKKRGLRNVCIFSAMSWKATALRIVAERAAEGPVRQQAIRDAKKACRAAMSITKSYLACRPHALRETGIVAAMEGNQDLARRSFTESLQVAEKFGARYDHAKTTLAQGQAGLKFHWPNAAEEVTQATTLIKQIETVE